MMGKIPRRPEPFALLSSCSERSLDSPSPWGSSPFSTAANITKRIKWMWRTKWRKKMKSWRKMNMRKEEEDEYEEEEEEVERKEVEVEEELEDNAEEERG